MEKNREEIQGVQNGEEQRGDTGSSERRRTERRNREFRTEKSREEIQEVQDEREQREDTGSSGQHRAERRYREFRTK